MWPRWAQRCVGVGGIWYFQYHALQQEAQITQVVVCFHKFEEHLTGLFPRRINLGPHKYSPRLLPSSGSFLADASRSATLAANDTCLLLPCARQPALRAFLSAFRFLFCISFSYTAHLFSCWVRRFWAARSLSRLGTLSSCCSSWISSRWLAMVAEREDGKNGRWRGGGRGDGRRGWRGS